VRKLVGRILFKWRSLVCLPMIAILPASLMADDSGAAMLRSNPGVLLNKNSAPTASALFPDDIIETQKEAVARIEAAGSTADINPDTMVQFEADELVLEHGSLSVNTNRGLRVRVGCVTVTPVNADLPNEWTNYNVTDLDGKVTVSALRNDVYMSSRSSNRPQVRESAQSTRTIVRESEQKSREEKCGAAVPQSSGTVPQLGAILNSPWAKIVGIVAVVVGACFGICHGDDPLSPYRP
jgi:hypothetical protein